MESTLATIQKFAKVGKILSKIALVMSIVGLVSISFIIAATVASNFLPDDFKEDVIYKFIEEKSYLSIGDLYISLAIGLIESIGLCIVSKYSNRYFKNELEVGTPFTLDGAKEILRLGIISLVVPLVTGTLCSAVYEIMKRVSEEITDPKLKFGIPAVMGISFIFLSFVFKFVAEKESMSHKKKNMEIE